MLARIQDVVRQVETRGPVGCDARLQYARALDVCAQFQRGQLIQHDAECALSELTDRIAANRGLVRSAWLVARVWIGALMSVLSLVVWNHVANIQQTAIDVAALVQQNKVLLASLAQHIPLRETLWGTLCACWTLMGEPPVWESPYDLARRVVDVPPLRPGWSVLGQFVQNVGWMDTTRAQERVGQLISHHYLVVERFQSDTNSMFRSARVMMWTTVGCVGASMALWALTMVYQWCAAPLIPRATRTTPRRIRKRSRRSKRKKRSKSKK
jgi:hypothetical protein